MQSVQKVLNDFLNNHAKRTVEFGEVKTVPAEKKKTNIRDELPNIRLLLNEQSFLSHTNHVY